LGGARNKLDTTIQPATGQFSFQNVSPNGRYIHTATLLAAVSLDRRRGRIGEDPNSRTLRSGNDLGSTTRRSRKPPASTTSDMRQNGNSAVAGAYAAISGRAENLRSSDGHLVWNRRLLSNRSRTEGRRVANGKGFVTGGYDWGLNGKFGLVDRGSGSWDATNNSPARSYHSATLLQNGKVLVVEVLTVLIGLNTGRVYDSAMAFGRRQQSHGSEKRTPAVPLSKREKRLVTGA